MAQRMGEEHLGQRADDRARVASTEDRLLVERNAETDQLSRDVNRLGRLLGEVLRDQDGQAAFDLVEEFRAKTKALRASEPLPGDFGALGLALQERTARLSLGEAHLLVRAFTAYFHLVNLAEENHRLRVLRQRQLATPRGESIARALLEAAQQALPAATVLGFLERCSVEPVFTAHPTEARRRTVLDKLRRLGELVEDLDDPRMPPSEAERLVTHVREEIASLWLTEEVRDRAPSVLDEVQNGLYYFEEALWDVVPALYRDLEHALHQSYPSLSPEAPRLLRFGSWIGGDRDGNPNVTAALTAQTLRLHKETALALYERELTALQRHLSVTERGATPSTGASDEEEPEQGLAIAGLLEEYGALMPDLAPALNARFTREPYRRLLGFMVARLRAARRLNAARLRADGSDAEMDSAGTRSGGETDIWRGRANAGAPRADDASVQY
ncbi:MAG TPA: phosphoenolpyruvate carboxylase, partial [Chloroflexota bacterium]|nr:phosphoenolpyruvate carboxylase [Chloroflexota bacterium]